MRAECIQAVAQAIGKPLTQVQVRDIEERIRRSMRTLARDDPEWATKSAPQRLQEAGAHAAGELVLEAQKKAQREALTIAAHGRITQFMADQAAAGMEGLDALDRIVAFHADGKANTLSIESQAKAIRNDSLRQILDTLTASNPKWFGLFENHEGIRQVIKGLFGEEAVPEAKKGAELWQTVAEQLRQRFNAAGGDVGKLEDWRYPQHHSQMRVAKAGRETWVTDLMPWINRDKYIREDGQPMSAQEIAAFHGGAWTTIATGGANKLEPGRAAGSGMRANRGNQSRQIHFKDADSFIAYQQKYGEKSLYEVLVGHIEGVAKDIALVETLGPNADHTFRYFRDTAFKAGAEADATKLGEMKQRAVRSESLYNVVSGKTLPVASEWLARTFDTLRSWLTASRLGSAVISSFSDDATLHLTGKMNNLPEMRLIANELSALNPANQLEKRMALRAGLAMNTFLSTLNRFGQDGLGASFASKLASTVLRASGLNAITEARKRAFGVTMMSSLGAIARDAESLAKLDKTDHRILLSKGITKNDFAVWKLAELEDWGGGNDTMLTPDAIYKIPDAKLAEFGDPARVREQAATRLLGVVLEETDVAVIEPGAVERAFMGAGLQRGTWKGELTRSFFLFKSFPLAMINRHWVRGMSQPNTGGRIGYLGTLIAATTAIGMVSLQVSQVLAGKDPRNMDVTEGWDGVRNWIAALLKGGSLGIYGDFLFSETSSTGRSITAQIAGPVIGAGEELFSLTQGNLMQAAAGKDTHAGAEVVRFTQSNLPGANLWYLKGSLDHVIFHNMQEYFSPGYLRQMKQRAYRDYGQRYWWEPGDFAPNRAPDLTAAAGE
jgi:hypothetical protein